MVSVQPLGTAWTIWKVARKRVGPVGASIATVAILGGMVYLAPWLAVKYPAIAAVVTKVTQGKRSVPE
ncbi:hypothetical protein [Halorubrum sp. DTA46]|uniref:hypothetical protein n=1 Tax=Halorubrum sp. DTA46 TaxID=3402162 RepID=UPI003AB0E33A